MFGVRGGINDNGVIPTSLFSVFGVIGGINDTGTRNIFLPAYLVCLVSEVGSMTMW